MRVLHERKVAIALGVFMAWVAESPQYKIESMLARLRGVARRHKAMGLQFVSLTTVVMAADGMVQEYIDVLGADSQMPKSKEPFHTSELLAMLALPAGTRVAWGGGSVVVGPGIEWQGVRVFIALFATMGKKNSTHAWLNDSAEARG
jgi:hypothetical protein